MERYNVFYWVVGPLPPLDSVGASLGTTEYEECTYRILVELSYSRSIVQYRQCAESI